MADVRPFQALRYNKWIAGDPATLIAPPYDVVSEAEKQELYRRGPFNVSLVDYGEDEPEDNEDSNRYTRAGEDLRAWQHIGVLARDPEPHLYIYDQDFKVHGLTMRRRAVFAMLRLEELDKGIVFPHEATGAAAKAERLNLLRGTRVHLSPIMMLYEPDRDASVWPGSVGEPLFDAVIGEERHTLRPLESRAADTFCRAFLHKKLYIADGHHRYETGLNYRNEVRDRASGWTGDEPENFILVALIAADDPGLVVLPTDRMLRLPGRPDDLTGPLSELWNVEDAGENNEENVKALGNRLTGAGRSGPAFGAAGLQPGRLHLLTPRSLNDVVARTPEGNSQDWRRLDVAVLEHAVLPQIGFDAQPENIDYTEEHTHAAAAVAAGEWDVALFLNPTPVERVIAVAGKGERMPRKSTFFFPKLATGMLMLPID